MMQFKKCQKSQIKFATSEKMPTFAIPKEKAQFFEVYFCVDARRFDDEEGSYLLVMTD